MGCYWRRQRTKTENQDREPRIKKNIKNVEKRIRQDKDGENEIKQFTRLAKQFGRLKKRIGERTKFSDFRALSTQFPKKI